MKRRRRSILPEILFAIILLLLCVLAGAVFWTVRELPRMAEEAFGPPAVRLSASQRVIYSGRLYLARRDLLEPVNTQGVPVPFTIEMGESVGQIANRLDREGLIRDADAFELYLIYSGLDTGVQAGEYQLSPALNSVQIALALQDATPAEVSFSILPGWRAEEIADALPTSGLQVTREELLAVIHDPQRIDLPEVLAGVDSLEGFLFPDVYRIKREASAEEMVQAFVDRFEREVDADLRAAIDGQGLNLREAVALASLVQREAVVAEEQPMIASVFYNRLASSMKLDSDPTAQYAIGYNEEQKTWWTNPLSLDDLQVDSPYNTYIYPGLPPGPICNPGISAIRAVAYPARTPYYYFRARCDGSGRHLFARTFEEHNQNACP